eukprot:gnl/TRDRNA2_/TRDRNA2_171385_c0_seq4.p2 gnl/TRDRNA2_/TRDRNA2_171385_c0~~gnl/TRDRNA2_/TRDRNA2_171385_c0_seq4.p2  ORF type:complete len:446 (-),score=114.76 gnl/TRDRNA2_/TRDRNA2_171385_c0_seq4:116-1339(-)
MQRTAVAAAFVCLGLSFLAFVILPNDMPDSTADTQVPLLKDESALIQKEVTIHRSTASAHMQDSNTMMEQVEEMAGELLTYEADAENAAEADAWHEAMNEDTHLIPQGLKNCSDFHDRDVTPAVEGKFFTNGAQMAETSYRGAWEIEDATQAYIASMDNMSAFIGQGFKDRNGRFYTLYMNKVVNQLEVLIGHTSIQYMDIATAGVNATSFGEESGTGINKTKTLMNMMAKDAIKTMEDVGKTIDQMNKQYAPGTGMGFVEEQMGGWRELCPDIKEPMLTALDKLNTLVDTYKKHSIVFMEQIDSNLANYPEDFQPQVEQLTTFVDRMLGMNINVFLKLQDDLYVGIESLALKYRICSKPTNKPLHQVQKEKRRGSIMHRPVKDDSGAASVSLGLAAAAAVCVASLS